MGPMARPRPTRSTRMARVGLARLFAAAGLLPLLGGMGVIVITTGALDHLEGFGKAQ